MIKNRAINIKVNKIVTGGNTGTKPPVSSGSISDTLKKYNLTLPLTGLDANLTVGEDVIGNIDPMGSDWSWMHYNTIATLGTVLKYDLQRIGGPNAEQAIKFIDQNAYAPQSVGIYPDYDNFIFGASLLLNLYTYATNMSALPAFGGSFEYGATVGKALMEHFLVADNSYGIKAEYEPDIYNW